MNKYEPLQHLTQITIFSVQVLCVGRFTIGFKHLQKTITDVATSGSFHFLFNLIMSEIKDFHTSLPNMSICLLSSRKMK